ncbi:hypothetical protein C8Q75DRAFT_712387 [Abortiporus biennis]|nr:hypothetical protein C8Q75DRAFT_712387 [Abortiporus biennis]
MYRDIHSLYRALIPHPHQRKPFSTHWTTIAYHFGYFIPFFALCYCARRRDTSYIRLALLPVIILWALHGTFAYDVEYHPRELLTQWSRGLYAFMVIIFSLELSLSEHGRLRIGEKVLPGIGEATTVEKKQQLNDPNPAQKTWVQRNLPLWFRDIFDVILSLRGMGWEFGEGVYIPKPNRPLWRGPFLKSTAVHVIQDFLVIDILSTIIRNLPGMDPHYGGTIFYASLPPILRYLVSSLITILTGSALIVGMNLEKGIVALFSVGVLFRPPSEFPPLFGDNLVCSDSVHDFWNRQWHQCLRRMFVVMGGIPGKWIADRYGFILGTFVASGLFHELSFYLVNRGVDHRVTWFFVSQGIAMILEEIFRRVSGKRVGGLWGRMWTWMITIGFGQLCVDAWLSRGVGVSVFISENSSPTRRFILPFIRSFLPKS